MAETDNLLRQVRDIADPCEAIIAEAQRAGTAEGIAPEVAAACLDLEAAMRRVFEIASYLVKETRR